MKTILLYDGSFSGFLTAVYLVFHHRMQEVQITNAGHCEQGFFDDYRSVQTDEEKARAVWEALTVKVGRKGASDLYRTFLSEFKGVEKVLLNYILYAYSTESFSATNYAVKEVQRVAQVSKMVSREKERLEQSLQFEEACAGVRFACAEPDYNVIPLLINHFKNRYRKQKWVIYDLKRNFGIYYDTERVVRIEIPWDTPLNVDGSGRELQEAPVAYGQGKPALFRMGSPEVMRQLKKRLARVPELYWKTDTAVFGMQA